MTILSLITGGIHLHTSRHPWESKKTRYSVKNISKINNTSPLVSLSHNNISSMKSGNQHAIQELSINFNEYTEFEWVWFEYIIYWLQNEISSNIYETDVEKIFIVIYLLVMYVLLYMSFIFEITYLFRSASFSFYGVFFQCVNCLVNLRGVQMWERRESWGVYPMSSQYFTMFCSISRNCDLWLHCYYSWTQFDYIVITVCQMPVHTMYVVDSIFILYTVNLRLFYYILK